MQRFSIQMLNERHGRKGEKQIYKIVDEAECRKYRSDCSAVLEKMCSLLFRFLYPLPAQKMRPCNYSAESPAEKCVPPNHVITNARNPLEKISSCHANCQGPRCYKGRVQSIVCTLE